MDRKATILKLPDNIKEQFFKAFEDGVESVYDIKSREPGKKFQTVVERVKVCTIGVMFNNRTKKLDVRLYSHPMDILNYHDDVLIAVGEKEWLKGSNPNSPKQI